MDLKDALERQMDESEDRRRAGGRSGGRAIAEDVLVGCVSRCQDRAVDSEKSKQIRLKWEDEKKEEKRARKRSERWWTRKLSEYKNRGRKWKFAISRRTNGGGKCGEKWTTRSDDDRTGKIKWSGKAERTRSTSVRKVWQCKCLVLNGSWQKSQRRSYDVDCRPIWRRPHEDTEEERCLQSACVVWHWKMISGRSKVRVRFRSRNLWSKINSTELNLMHSEEDEDEAGCGERSERQRQKWNGCEAQRTHLVRENG